MGQWCMVLQCKNCSKNSSLSFFSLTKKRYRSWMKAIGRDPSIEKLSHGNVICEEHFISRKISPTAIFREHDLKLPIQIFVLYTVSSDMSFITKGKTGPDSDNSAHAPTLIFLKSARDSKRLILEKFLWHSSYRLYFSGNTNCNFVQENRITQNSANIAVALSILSWLGFTEEDENKESELIMTLKKSSIVQKARQFEKA
ncbi:hypothetical protein JTB14_035060 [Gonioctena quinquepunctata]|nr:hypothetical protein JTB14_035060 [Gonioctena quinquepunctata]